MKHVGYVALGALLIIAIIGVVCFKREYVIPGDGLVGVAASRVDNIVKVSGSIQSSGAKIVKTTTARNGDAILLRVYADRIRENDDPKECFGSFAIVIPLETGINSIQAGESPRVLTIGRLWGMPIRLPRLHRNTAAARLVWARGPGT
jgi:hypothetical protein